MELLCARPSPFTIRTEGMARKDTMDSQGEPVVTTGCVREYPDVFPMGLESRVEEFGRPRALSTRVISVGE
jgi:hypothetical protein